MAWLANGGDIAGAYSRLLSKKPCLSRNIAYSVSCICLAFQSHVRPRFFNIFALKCCGMGGIAQTVGSLCVALRGVLAAETGRLRRPNVPFRKPKRHVWGSVSAFVLRQAGGSCFLVVYVQVGLCLGLWHRRVWQPCVEALANGRWQSAVTASCTRGRALCTCAPADCSSAPSVRAGCRGACRPARGRTWCR